MPVSTGQIKLKLSKLFKSELGFIKSANLAGEIIKLGHGGGDYRASNENQFVLSYLIQATSILKHAPAFELLWCHQKATGNNIWFFKIGTSASDLSSALDWYLKKAKGFAEQCGEAEYFTKEVVTCRLNKTTEIHSISSMAHNSNTPTRKRVSSASDIQPAAPDQPHAEIDPSGITNKRQQLLERAEELGGSIQLEFYKVVEQHTANKYGDDIGRRLAAAMANYVFKFGFVAPTHIGDQSLRNIFINETTQCLSLFGDAFKTNATGVLILLGAAWQLDLMEYKAHMRWLANFGFIKSGKLTPNVERELAGSHPAYMYCIALEEF